MKRMFFALAAGILLAGSTGCLHHQTHCKSCDVGGPCGCQACSGGGHAGGAYAGGEYGEGGPGMHHGGRHGGIFGKLKAAHYANRGWRHQTPETGPEGPPSATVGYPYYTLRGPRDFFADNPPTIGN